jgi:hypothetical protein
MNASSYIPTISICRKRPWAIHGGAFLVAIVLVEIVADDRDRASHRNLSASLERVGFHEVGTQQHWPAWPRRGRQRGSLRPRLTSIGRGLRRS